MDAAVVELDPLPDAVGAAAEDHDFLFVGIADFVELVVVRGIIVRRVGFELGGAGVDEAVGGVETQFRTKIPDILFCQRFLFRRPSSGYLTVGES